MRAMMSLSRYVLAVVVLIVTSLTPSSCSDVAEEAMAYEVTGAAVRVDLTREGRMERVDLGADLQLDGAPESDTDEIGS